VQPIAAEKLQARIAKAQRLMREEDIQALYLDTSTNLRHFTGVALNLTERLHGAVIPADGPPVLLSPAFEEPKTRELMQFDAGSRTWEEQESLLLARPTPKQQHGKWAKAQSSWTQPGAVARAARTCQAGQTKSRQRVTADGRD